MFLLCLATAKLVVKMSVLFDCFISTTVDPDFDTHLAILKILYE